MGNSIGLLAGAMISAMAVSSFAQAPENKFDPEPAKKQEELLPPQQNPVKDYTLAALNKIGDGWFVVLLHKKDRSRIRLRSNQKSESGFKLGSVENPNGRDARVQIEFQGEKSWVEFERRHLPVPKRVIPEIPLERHYRINIEAIRQGHVRIVPTRPQR